MGNLKTIEIKKLLLLIATLTALSTKAQTSVYHPFPDSNAVWNIHFTGSCMIGTDEEFYSIFLSGDTLINSETYHKFFTPFVQSFLSGSCTVTNLTGYKGAIRQDTLAKKVFYIPPTSSTEQLLYDYNLQIGDTVKGFLESFALSQDTVYSIDSVLVGSNYYKRWNINTCYNIYIIEGIGSTYGLLQLSPGCATDFPDYSINCFEQNGITLYPGTATNCQIITSVNSTAPISNQVKVFPNPSNGSFSVNFDQPINISEIQLTDLLGNIVFRQPSNNQKKIDIDNLPSGTYILTVIDKENKTTNRKIISCL